MDTVWIVLAAMGIFLGFIIFLTYMVITHGAK